MLNISDLIPITYSKIINTDKTIDLKKLVKDFSLDSSFISKSYYTQNWAYTEPAPGPIPKHFECLYCGKKGLNYHNVNCERPKESSLVLYEESDNFKTIGTKYDALIVKPGQKKVASKSTNSEILYDTIEIRYKYPDNKECIIRIYSNGKINIISAQYSDKNLDKLILDKINEKVVSENYYLISAQFYLYPRNLTDSVYVNLIVLNNLIKNYKAGNTILNQHGKSYFLKNYHYNSGEDCSKLGNITNPYIQFVLLENGIKITVMIYKRGAVQLRLSLDDKKSILDYNILNEVYSFLKELFTDIDEENKLLVEEKSTKLSKIPNMRTSQPEKCQNREGDNPGEGDYRPVPYIFYGNCPMDGYYVPPRGVQRKQDKLYEPCCRKLKNTGKDSVTRYRNILVNGYPDDLAEKYDEPVPVDGDSAVFIPGTKIIQNRSFVGLKTIWNNLSKEKLIGILQKYQYI